MKDQPLHITTAEKSSNVSLVANLGPSLGYPNTFRTGLSNYCCIPNPKAIRKQILIGQETEVIPRINGETCSPITKPKKPFERSNSNLGKEAQEISQTNSWPNSLLLKKKRGTRNCHPYKVVKQIDKSLFKSMSLTLPAGITSRGQF